MRPDQVERAAAALAAMKRGEEIVSALAAHEVLGIKLSCGAELCRGRSGTGSIASIGYPDDLQEAMTKALREWSCQRVRAAKAAAISAGVEL